MTNEGYDNGVLLFFFFVVFCELMNPFICSKSLLAEMSDDDSGGGRGSSGKCD